MCCFGTSGNLAKVDEVHYNNWSTANKMLCNGSYKYLDDCNGRQVIREIPSSLYRV